MRLIIIDVYLRKWRAGEGTGGYFDNQYKNDDVDDNAETSLRVFVDDKLYLDDGIDDKDITVDGEDLSNPNDATLEDDDKNNRSNGNRKESFDRRYRIALSPSHAPFCLHDKARDLDVEVYNSILKQRTNLRQCGANPATWSSRILYR